MQQLAVCDDVFSHWFHRGRSRKNALEREIYFQDKEEIIALLENGRNRRDTSGKAIEELGVRIGLWNGIGEGKSVGVSITCGMYSETQGVGSNCINMDFPEDIGELQNPEKACRVLSIVASCWKPNWAGIFSNAAMDSHNWGQEPLVDWMVYIPGTVQEVPSPSTIVSLEDEGSIVIVQPKPPVFDNKEDQEQVQTIRRILTA